MHQQRAGESGRGIPPRSERFYKLDDDWYFQVRGGKSFGPFPCRAEAERAVRHFFGTGGPGDNPYAQCGKNGSGAVVHPFGSLRARRWHRFNRR
ncbi:DUF6316 family protein [Microbulbifer yueqingensis]|uniref:DUF6316 domain-containing protein n=1 Tax=Microbulbifer yueqingensis TaxID=658219 RepID=A0A1G9DJB2_9GAMM|nr:DUF6316 family protein [Microbulbifer yueqingensis]SDK64001.1 hypothetical protein SAMN05216212_2832 [Microbulbifer yueqingensis]